ncbi:MAG TPA: exopolysaccharide biosynthesis polyprenyl glycosylphosphotransferase [Nocardioidaceae bacterium]|nr:exopolysaccharide biosynthesis polyprenyl glycosylphosphotransferase [Nocardioidaceae bacterium]
MTAIGVPVAGLTFVTCAVVWRARSLYERRVSMSVLDDSGALLAGGAAGVGAALAGAVTFASWDPSHALAGAVTTVSLVVLARAAAYAVLLRRRRTLAVGYPTVIVGAGPVGIDLARRLVRHPEAGLRPIGFVGDPDEVPDAPAPVLGAVTDLPRLVRDHCVTDVVVGYVGGSESELVDVVRSCDREDVEIHILPRLFEIHRLGPGCDQAWGVPLVRMRRLAFRSLSWRVKRVTDVVGAATALLLLAPLLVCTAVMVRLELGRGILFHQERVGLDGRLIRITKFRSMRPPPDGEASPWTVAGGGRIGPVGRFIRRYSIDELPQLLNVLKGDMSLVGPRPERPEYVQLFTADVPRYGARHRLPVGLTGLAAVHGLRGDTSIQDRACFDNLYIENWSLALDLKILVRTVLSVVRGTGT